MFFLGVFFFPPNITGVFLPGVYCEQQCCMYGAKKQESSSSPHSAAACLVDIDLTTAASLGGATQSSVQRELRDWGNHSCYLQNTHIISKLPKLKLLNMNYFAT